MNRSETIGFSIFISPPERRAGGKHLYCEVSCGSFYPAPFYLKADSSEVYILGTPIWKKRIDKEAIAGLCLEKNLDLNRIREINGSFLIVRFDAEAAKVHVITDRFGSISFFLGQSEHGYHGSTCYTDIWLSLKRQGSLKINPLSFYEFIHFQKLLGAKTFDEKTKCLSSASVLEVSAKDKIHCNSRKYWHPSYRKTNVSVYTNTQKLAELLRCSYEKYTSDNLSYGLLLSGGLDSRAVLAAAGKPLPCFTVGEYKNNEYQVAHLVAEAKGCKHYFVRRSHNHYGKILKSAVKLGSSMNTFDHAHFMGLDDRLKPYSDVLFHGHGLDYFFQGMYLPVEPVMFAGKSTYITRLKQVSGNLAEIFSNSVKYRLKDLNPLSLIKKSLRMRAKDFVLRSVADITEEAANFCHDEYDIWEYLHTFNLSRHYTHLNIESLRSFTEERCLAFENDLFDFYRSMPVEHRLGGRVFKKAIGLMSPELMCIRNANTKLKASYTPIQATALDYLSKIWKRLGKRSLVQVSSPKKERSWPDRNALIKDDIDLYRRTEKLKKSERLDSLGILNMDFVNGCINSHLSAKAKYGALILTLLTVDEFLDL